VQKINNFTMKKMKIEGKLSLNKETVAKLNDLDMGQVKGGWPTNTYQSILLCPASEFCHSANLGCTGALSGCPVC
jgi:hypothetical protein